MIPAKFEYKRAATVSEAVSLLGEHGSEAKIVSGGHSLVPAMKLRMSRPDILIDIKRIPGLDTITEAGDEIVIGANCTHTQVMRSELVQKHVNIVHQAVSKIGDIQIRNRGTIGGSLAHADPSSDYPAVVLACEAQIEVQGKEGQRTIPATEFFLGLFWTALEEDEIITAVRFPKVANGNYQKFFQSASRFAVVGVAAVQDGNSVRVGVTGVAGCPYRATAVEEAYSGNSEAAEHAVDGVEDLMSDHFADETYRAHLAKVLVKKALDAL